MYIYYWYIPYCLQSKKDRREKNEAELLKNEAKLRNKELVMVSF